jgi:hypothetical protein
MQVLCVCSKNSLQMHKHLLHDEHVGSKGGVTFNYCV